MNIGALQVCALTVLPMFASLASAEPLSGGRAELATSRPSTPRFGDPSQVCGAYIEVVPAAGGFAKTGRCNPDDQLLFEPSATGVTMRWASAPGPSTLPPLVLEDGRLQIVQPHRSITIERVTDQVIRLTFQRRGQQPKSYLYGSIEFAQKLPMGRSAESGCPM